MIKFTRLVVMITLVVVAAFNTTSAQTNGGPDQYGYTWRDSNDPNGPAYNWVDIVGIPGAVSVSGLLDDNSVGPFAIGFDFHFYWYDVSTFRIGSNGYIVFSSTVASYPFYAIPNTLGAQDYIGGMATDLTFVDNTTPTPQPVPNAQLWYWTNPGNDTLIITYKDVPFWNQNSPGYSGLNTFQMILSNVDSSITYQYQLQQGTVNNVTANFITIGIENNSGTIGLQHSHDIMPPVNYAVKFYYPQTVTLSIYDAATVFNNNPETGGLFLSKNGAPFTMNTQIKNTGNQNLPVFNVFSRVINKFSQIQAQSTISSSVLAPGQTEDITFVPTFAPTDSGVYRYINDTQLPGDATPINNQKIMELQVIDTTRASVLLSFDSNPVATTGVSWSGGVGGIGMYFLPPYAPTTILQTRAFIVSNTSAAGYYIYIFDDDGPNATPLTMLDSVYVPAANVIAPGWNYHTVSAPVQNVSGGFYVAWMMGGPNIILGEDTQAPYSNRCFEILGSPFNPNTWSAYRGGEITDMMINAYIAGVPVGISETPKNGAFGEFYPNPSSGKLNLNFNFVKQVDEIQVEIISLDGQLVRNQQLVTSGFNGIIEVDGSNLAVGIYTCKITAGGEMFTRRFNIIR